MLLLILVTGCVTVCSAQTMIPDSEMYILPPLKESPLLQANADKVIMILKMTVRSTEELNKVKAAVYHQLKKIIQKIHPELYFKAFLRSISLKRPPTSSAQKKDLKRDA